ncbi:MAG: alpha-1,4-glucan--maltose-1-phosphate maltosyltransferase [Rhodothermales bacterium]|nr:alpha-1,4-glucan--maltose-1-phosphate maltosyltransferase [Rhodothermales bacterium]
MVIVSVDPQVDGGQWPVRRSVGETVEVVAGVIIDGHDRLAVELLYRHEGDGDEQVVRMPLRYNDEYVGRFPVEQLGRYTYRVRAWVDRFGTWQDQFRRRVEGGESERELKSELQDGAALLREAARHAPARAARQLRDYADAFEEGAIDDALDAHVVRLARDHDPREGAVESRPFAVEVDPEHARFAAWYEFFPRSAAAEAGVHGTLDDAAARLPRIKELGFDVVYLPPIHPIGEAFRKGKDNAPAAQPGEPGSPWAIGGRLGDGTLGGHKSVHPELGGLDAFDRFVAKADELGLKVALDVAFQTSPDHPYVQDHPAWFRQRPDGTIRYAENPPKKYQDVYPFDFEGDDWEALWEELKSVFDFWIDHGVRVFRVDNPHTKPFAFWEWCLAALRRDHPDLIFLAEAFSRPKIMYTLAKLGFNNSYTYFAWRNTRHELEEYLAELSGEVGEFFRPNFWPNTPDILTEYLAHGGRPAHVIRFILAATLSSVYGVYGPPYEHVYNTQHPKREEYADNEKYEIRTWNWNDPDSLQPLMKRVNKIRRENPALQFWRNVTFHRCDNPNVLAYSKAHGDNLILCTVSVNPFQAEAGWVHLPLEDWGLAAGEPFEVEDLLRGEFYLWHGAANFVHLDPGVMPAHLFRIRRRGRTEQDFEYFV